MKRIKRKYFKRQKDLIRYSVRRAIHRCDVLEPEKYAEQLKTYLKEYNWLEWCKRKLEKPR